MLDSRWGPETVIEGPLDVSGPLERKIFGPS